MPDTALRKDFLEGMSRAAATVSVVTTDGAAGRAGVTVSAMTSISADGDAPTMLVCLNKTSSAAAPLLENGCFVINVLEAGQQAVADVFASRVAAPGGDKFNAVGHKVMLTGAPALDGALVAFDCDLQSAELVGTHYVAIGAVKSVRLRDAGTPLVYGMRSYLRAEPA
jgi:flavin reductase